MKNIFMSAETFKCCQRAVEPCDDGSRQRFAFINSDATGQTSPAIAAKAKQHTTRTRTRWNQCGGCGCAGQSSEAS